MKHKIAFSLLLAAALTLGTLLSGCSSESDEPKPLLQSFTAATLDGGSFTQADLEDKDLTIMNFWGTFCTPCVDEMPDLATFAQALPDNVGFLTVCVDVGGDPTNAKSILDQSGYEGITLISGDGDFAALVQAVQSLPTTIFVDNQGNLVGDVIVGGRENLSKDFLAAANKALKASGKAEISLAD